MKKENAAQQDVHYRTSPPAPNVPLIANEELSHAHVHCSIVRVVLVLFVPTVPLFLPLFELVCMYATYNAIQLVIFAQVCSRSVSVRPLRV